MKIKLKIFLFILFAFLFQLFTELNFCAGEEELIILTGEFPPLSYTEKGVPKGISVEIANEIQKKLGKNIKYKFVPWARGYNQTQTDSNTVLFSTTRTEERENLFKWVGPIVERTFSFYKRSNSNITVENIDSAKKYKIGVMRESCNDQLLTKFKFPKLDKVVNEDLNLKKLLAKRVDLIFTDNAQAELQISKLKKDGFNFNKVEIIACYPVEKHSSYFAFNINTSDEIVTKWQKALDELYADGTVLNILKKYNFESLYYKKNQLSYKSKTSK